MDGMFDDLIPTGTMKTVSFDDLIPSSPVQRKKGIKQQRALDPYDFLREAQKADPQPQIDNSNMAGRFADAAGRGFNKGFGDQPIGDGKVGHYLPATPFTNGLNLMIDKGLDLGMTGLRALGGVARSGTHVAAQAGQEMGLSPSSAKRLERDLAGMVEVGAIMSGAPNTVLSGGLKKMGSRVPDQGQIMQTSKDIVTLPTKVVPRIVRELVSDTTGAIKDSVKHKFQADDTVAADILNKTIQRSGKTPDQILADFKEGQRATRFGKYNSRLPESLAELGDEATQSLLETTIISPGRARSIVKNRINDRQRGTRSPFSTEKLPDTVGEQQVLYGQRERLLDNLSRSLEIKSTGSALKTERDILIELRRESGPLYKKAFQQADDFDLSDVIQGAKVELDDMSGGIKSSLNKAISYFERRLPESAHNLPLNKKLKRFDNAKKALDDMISIKKRGGKSEAVRVLTRFKNDMLNAVHGGDKLNPTQNTFYASARDLYSGGKRMQDAIQKGRDTFKEGAELTAEMVQGLNQGELKMLRLGFYDAVKKNLGRKKRTDDATQLFRRAEFADLHKAIAPHKKSKDALTKPSDQFGELLDREQRMVETKNMLGGSRTAFRIESAKDFNTLADFSRRMKENNLLSAVADTVGMVIRETLGMREEVSTRLADLLTSTDPKQIERALNVIKSRYGPTKSSELGSNLIEIMADNESALRAGYLSDGSR